MLETGLLLKEWEFGFSAIVSSEEKQSNSGSNSNVYLKFCAAAAIAIPFSLVGAGFTNDSAIAARYLVKSAPTTALAFSPLSPSSTLVTQTVWKEFSSSEGKFAVSMPGTPKQETETDEDGLTSHSFTVELENPDSAYLVTYYDVPEVAKATPEQIKELLDGAPDAFAKGGNANLTRSQNIILDGNPGREFEFTSTEGFSGKGRVYLVQERLFLVVAIAPQSQSIQRFLDSFRLL
ncbi:MAG TPA: hypothetical protein DDW76_03580 [Cyanobacteria bacterium UBA11369]|nr:hypothetical protein [Cyanobacteria bacterium UBA11371]HBE33352.1 hypothetical protein [Cyanobacteria bacterium UBA11368]HBE47899.1 hypothetical protein [Cyanobacteria bacterium UBA11369]